MEEQMYSVVRCKICGKKPSELTEYKHEKNPEKFIIENEGTFNECTGKFYCTDCYVKVGCPSGKA